MNRFVGLLHSNLGRSFAVVTVISDGHSMLLRDWVLGGLGMHACLAVAAATWREAEAEFTKAAGIARVHVSMVQRETAAQVNVSSCCETEMSMNLWLF